MEDTQTTPNNQSRKWDGLGTNLIIAITIFVIAMIVFTIGRNVSFIGDDDYLYSNGFADFGRLLRLPLSATGLKQYCIDFVKNVYFLRHGPLPSFYFGVFYRIVELLHIPVTIQLLHLPVAFLGAITVILFPLALKRYGFSDVLAWSGALLLITSPIFAMASW